MATLAARLADVQIEDFKAFRPPPGHFGRRDSKILLPQDNALVFQRNFAAYNLAALLADRLDSAQHHERRRSRKAHRHE